MKPRGIWIAIGMILVIGILSTDYVKKRTSGIEESAVAVSKNASVFAGDFSARESTKAEDFVQDFSMDRKRSTDVRSQALKPDGGDSPDAEDKKQNMEKLSPATASESGKAVIVGQGADTAPEPPEESPSLTQEETVWSELPREEEDIENPVLIRLQELDGQIAANQFRESENTTGSRKASSENEWMLWETELQRILGILKEKLEPQEQEALMHEQIEWMKSREEEAVNASQKELGGTMEEVNYNRSRAKRTRSRAYELAEAYADLFRE